MTNPSLPFLLPWLKLALLIRSITGTTWDDATWPNGAGGVMKALRMRSALARAPWWS